MIRSISIIIILKIILSTRLLDKINEELFFASLKYLKNSYCINALRHSSSIKLTFIKERMTIISNKNSYFQIKG